MTALVCTVAFPWLLVKASVCAEASLPSPALRVDAQSDSFLLFSILWIFSLLYSRRSSSDSHLS